MASGHVHGVLEPPCRPRSDPPQPRVPRAQVTKMRSLLWCATMAAAALITARAETGAYGTKTHATYGDKAPGGTYGSMPGTYGAPTGASDSPPTDTPAPAPFNEDRSAGADADEGTRTTRCSTDPSRAECAPSDAQDPTATLTFQWQSTQGREAPCPADTDLWGYCGDKSATVTAPIVCQALAVSVNGTVEVRPF